MDNINNETPSNEYLIRCDRPGIEDIKLAVKQGYTEAMTLLSRSYFHGYFGLPQNNRLAKKYFNQAIHGGDGEAIRSQLMHLNKQDELQRKPLYGSSWKWLQMQEKHYPSIAVLSAIADGYTQGIPPMQQDIARANQYHQRICENAKSIHIRNIGLLKIMKNLIENLEIEDCKSFFTWLQINQGWLNSSPIFHSILALYYTRGLGSVEANEDLANHYINKAKQLGGINKSLDGVFIDVYLNSMKKPLIELIEECIKQSWSNSSAASRLVTYFIEQVKLGQINDDMDIIAQFMHKNENHAVANLYLGWFYWSQNEIDKGYTHYITAMEQGCAKARYIVEYLIRDKMVPQEVEEKLFQYFENLINENPADLGAHAHLATLLLNRGNWHTTIQGANTIDDPHTIATDVDDDAEAIKHYMIAARGLDPFAVECLSRLLRHEYIGYKDRDEAEEILNTAKKHGVEPSSFALTEFQRGTSSIEKNLYTSPYSGE